MWIGDYEISQEITSDMKKMKRNVHKWDNNIRILDLDTMKTMIHFLSRSLSLSLSLSQNLL